MSKEKEVESTAARFDLRTMVRPVQLNSEYLELQLGLDPRQSAARIIFLRNRQLGLRSSSNKTESLPQLRTPQAVAGARSALESIRKQFWTLPLEELRSRLSEIDLRPYPELASAVERLQQAAAVRAEFPRLAQRLDGDLGLFHCLKQSIAMPPLDVAGMKESVIRSLLGGDNIKTCKSTAQIIKEEFPQIYALEREWFDEILATKRLGRATAARQSEFKMGAPSWVYGLLIFLVIQMVRGCVTAMR